MLAAIYKTNSIASFTAYSNRDHIVHAELRQDLQVRKTIGTVNVGVY